MNLSFSEPMEIKGTFSKKTASKRKAYKIFLAIEVRNSRKKYKMWIDNQNLIIWQLVHLISWYYFRLS